MQDWQNWTAEEFQQALQEVGRRATIDSEFRALALKDAATAIARVAGKTIPGDLDFKFIDNSGPTKLVPLPDPIPGITYEEIGEEELDRVAGGISGPGTVAGTVGWSR